MWKRLEPVSSDSGVSLAPSATFADCPDDLDILFVPGGLGTAEMMARKSRVLPGVQRRHVRCNVPFIHVRPPRRVTLPCI